jgi:hypothetical protein
VADLKDVKGQTLSELGYDIRTGDGNPTENSHCGAGAPRFDVTLTDGTTWFIGCSSPATLPTSTNNGQGRKWLRWGPGPINASNDGTTTVDISGRTVQSIQVVFDQGQDNGSGVAFLDNVDVNGALVGRGEHGDH